MRLGGAACAQVIGLTCESLGPCVYGRPDARSRRAASAGSVADGLELWGSDGSRALLLAVLTLQCAAKTHWWHGGQPAQATTHRANVRVDAGVPWRYVACCGPAAARERRKQARRPPGTFHISTDTTEAGPRRVPPLVAGVGCAVSTEKSRYQQHVVSYNPKDAYCLACGDGAHTRNPLPQLGGGLQDVTSACRSRVSYYEALFCRVSRSSSNSLRYQVSVSALVLASSVRTEVRPGKSRQ